MDVAATDTRVAPSGEHHGHIDQQRCQFAAEAHEPQAAEATACATGGGAISAVGVISLLGILTRVPAVITATSWRAVV